MDQQFQIFDFNGNNVRVVIVEDEPWFVATDVCAVLDVDTSVAVNGRNRKDKGGNMYRDGGLDNDEKGTVIVSTPGGEQKLLAVNEPGLYHLISKSRKPEAKSFQRWVYHEVLPSIRKTGSYSINQQPQATYPAMSMEDIMIAQLQSMKEVKRQLAVIATEQEEFKNQQVVLQNQQAAQESKVEHMTKVLTATPDRQQFRRKINEYARLAKKSVANATKEAFSILEDKQGIALKTRVNNQWKKINGERATEGKKPLSQNSLKKEYNQMDVIEELNLLPELMQIVAGLIGAVAGQAEVATGECADEGDHNHSPLGKLNELYLNTRRVTFADVQEAMKLLSDCPREEQAEGYNIFKALQYKHDSQPAY